MENNRVTKWLWMGFGNKRLNTYQKDWNLVFNSLIERIWQTKQGKNRKNQ